MSKKFWAIVLSLVLVLSLIPATALAEDGETPSDAPASGKVLIDNHDGTYTIAMSVTGATQTTSSTEVTKANVVLVVDTSNSMNNSSGTSTPVTYTEFEGDGVQDREYYGKDEEGDYFRVYWRSSVAEGESHWRRSNANNGVQYTGTVYTMSGGTSRLAAEKDALTKEGGIIDKLLEQNVPGDPIKSDIIEVAIVNFSTRGNDAQGFTTSATALKDTINSLTTSQGTNWEEGLRHAKDYADTIKAEQEDEAVYIIFLTDGEPTTHYNDYTVNTNYAQEWAEANDDARAIVNEGYTFYALFTWGSGNSSHYLSSLVQYAYTGEGNSNSALSSEYAQYFTNASSTDALIAALSQIVKDITDSVGYTDVEMTDGVTNMTASNLKATVDGEVSGIKYYRSGGKYSTTANNGLGEEWTDAPKAKFNSNGEVDWALGDIVLENNVTYTMAFTVWPKQASLDLVADLNNGIVEYDSLTAEQKAQINNADGHYTLKTNTDFPTVTYSIQTTKTVNGEPTTTTSDPVTVKLENPKPVGLSESMLNAKKEWEDTLDPSQREEVGNSVVLYLLVDGDYYFLDENGKPMGVTLQKDKNWTETDYISIAPGILVTSDSPAYDASAPQVTWEGKTYAMIEKGHEYVFEESEINYHFELTAYTHHPMIMGADADGNLIVNDVTFTKDAEGNITGIESVVPLGDNISATNTLKGGINIEKKVVDTEGKEIECPDPFTVTVTVNAEDGKSELPLKTAEDGTKFNIDYRVYFGENNPNYGKDEYANKDKDTGAVKGYRTDHIYVAGDSFDQELYVGDVIRVVNVENGAKYSVTEEAPDGFELVDVKYTIAYAGKDEKEDPDQTVLGNSASTAVVTNKFVDARIKLTKEATGLEGSDVVPDTAKFVISRTTEDETEFEDVTVTYADIKDGDWSMIVPAGTYTVTESGAEVNGYTLETKYSADVTVKNSEEGELTVTNTYTKKPEEKIELTLTKVWDDNKNEYGVRPDEVVFVVTGSDGKTYEATLKGTEDTWTAKLEVPKAADGKDITYTVDEKAVPAGYVKTIKDFTITNAFTPCWGDPPVKKVVTGDKPAPTETFTFTLKAEKYEGDAKIDKLPMPEAAKGAQEMTVDIKGEGETEFGKFALVQEGVYTYTITEKKGSIEGYTYDDTVYTVVYTVKANKDTNALECVKTVNGTEIKGTEKENVAEFTFTNEFKKPADVPDTGDHNDMFLWGGVMVVSLLGVVFLAIKRRKEEQF